MKEIDCHNHNKEYRTHKATVSEVTNHRKKKRILVVDDEPDITSLFRKVLERQGFRVDIYNDPTDLLENFKPHFMIW